jgi:hypothetical protein
MLPTDDRKLEKHYKCLKSMDIKRQLGETVENRLRLVSYKKVYIIKDAWEIDGFTENVVL